MRRWAPDTMMLLRVIFSTVALVRTTTTHTWDVDAPLLFCWIPYNGGCIMPSVFVNNIKRWAKRENKREIYVGICDSAWNNKYLKNLRRRFQLKKFKNINLLSYDNISKYLREEDNFKFKRVSSDSLEREHEYTLRSYFGEYHVPENAEYRLPFLGQEVDLWKVFCLRALTVGLQRNMIFMDCDIKPGSIGKLDAEADFLMYMYRVKPSGCSFSRYQNAIIAATKNSEIFRSILKDIRDGIDGERFILSCKSLFTGEIDSRCSVCFISCLMEHRLFRIAPDAVRSRKFDILKAGPIELTVPGSTWKERDRKQGYFVGYTM